MIMDEVNGDVNTENNTVLSKSLRQNHGTEIEKPIRGQLERISSSNCAAMQSSVRHVVGMQRLPEPLIQCLL